MSYSSPISGITEQAERAMANARFSSVGREGTIIFLPKTLLPKTKSSGMWFLITNLTPPLRVSATLRVGRRFLGPRLPLPVDYSQARWIIPFAVRSFLLSFDTLLPPCPLKKPKHQRARPRDLAKHPWQQVSPELVLACIQTAKTLGRVMESHGTVPPGTLAIIVANVAVFLKVRGRKKQQEN
jgi:hypothetical protein